MAYQEYRIDKIALSSDSLLLHAIVTFFLGALLLLRPHLMSDLFAILICCLLAASGCAGLFAFLFGKKQEVRNIRQLAIAAISLPLAWFAYRVPRRAVTVLPLAIGVGALMSGFLHFVTCYLQRRNNEWVGIHGYFLGLLSVLLGGLLIIWPVALTDTAVVLAGIYCLMSAVTQYWDYLEEIRPSERPRRLWRRVRVERPSALMMLIPRSAQRKIDRRWEELSRQRPEKSEDTEKKSEDTEKPDFEIFIHATGKGLGTVGHMDFCFEDTVSTYGPYDFATHRMGGLICNGVLAVVKGRDRYLDFCTSYSQKTIFCYGLRLSPEQKEQVRGKIEELMKQVRPWQPTGKKRLRRFKVDYAEVLRDQLGASLYQFVRGEFQTYFMGGTNCAVLCDRIIGTLGTDILSPGILLTPGAYYNYLDRQYNKDDGLVVSKKVCRAEQTAEQA